jgi:hypothetical protein
VFATIHMLESEPFMKAMLGFEAFVNLTAVSQGADL